MESRRLRIWGKAVLGFLLFGWQFAPFTLPARCTSLHSQRNLSRISVSREQVWNITVGQESNGIRKTGVQQRQYLLKLPPGLGEDNDTKRFDSAFSLVHERVQFVSIIYKEPISEISPLIKFQKSVSRF